MSANPIDAALVMKFKEALGFALDTFPEDAKGDVPEMVNELTIRIIAYLEAGGISLVSQEQSVDTESNAAKRIFDMLDKWARKSPRRIILLQTEGKSCQVSLHETPDLAENPAVKSRGETIQDAMAHAAMTAEYQELLQ